MSDIPNGTWVRLYALVFGGCCCFVAFWTMSRVCCGWLDGFIFVLSLVLAEAKTTAVSGLLYTAGLFRSAGVVVTGVPLENE